MYFNIYDLYCSKEVKNSLFTPRSFANSINKLSSMQPQIKFPNNATPNQARFGKVTRGAPLPLRVHRKLRQKQRNTETL